MYNGEIFYTFYNYNQEIQIGVQARAAMFSTHTHNFTEIAYKSILHFKNFVFERINEFHKHWNFNYSFKFSFDTGQNILHEYENTLYSIYQPSSMISPKCQRCVQQNHIKIIEYCLMLLWYHFVGIKVTVMLYCVCFYHYFITWKLIRATVSTSQRKLAHITWYVITFLISYEPAFSVMWIPWWVSVSIYTIHGLVSVFRR